MNIVFLSGPRINGFERDVLETFFSDERHRMLGALVDMRPRPPALTRLRKNIRLGRGGYTFVLALASKVARRRTVEGTESFFAARGVPAIVSADPYGAETVEKVRALRPDVLVRVGGFGIVKEPLLTLAPEGVLSYHHGDMRRYRGQPPGFWELYHGEREMGVTVQRLAAGIDCGEPIVERRFVIPPGETFRSLTRRIFSESTDMLRAAVDRLEDERFAPERIESFGPVYTLPNLRQWLLFNMRVAGRAVRARIGQRAGSD